MDFEAKIDGSQPRDRGVREEEHAGDEARFVDPSPGHGLVEHLAGVVVDGGEDLADQDRAADQEGRVPPRGSRTWAGWPSQVPSMVIQLTLPGGTAAAPAGDDSASTSAASKTATIDNRRITMSMTSPLGRGSVVKK